MGYENYKVSEIADMVNKTLGGSIPIETTPSNDSRSYHVSSTKIRKEIGFKAMHSIEDAILDLRRAFEDGKIPNPLDDKRYYNIKTMQAIKLN